MRNNTFTALFLLFVSIMLLTIPLIPHHHHYADGDACMKKDMTTHTQCPCDEHSERPPAQCTYVCATSFEFHTPSLTHADVSPQYLYVVTLYTAPLLRLITQSADDLRYDREAYPESFYISILTPSNGFRAPPALFL